MATGTVTLHSWNDSRSDGPEAAEDEGWPPVGTNYNCRLKIKDDYNNSAAAGRKVRERGVRGGLRSTVVRPSRLGLDDDEDDADRRTSRW